VLSEGTDELISELAGIETCDDLQFKTTLAASFIYKFYLQKIMMNSKNIYDKCFKSS
jgi:hypothetical protein